MKFAEMESNAKRLQGGTKPVSQASSLPRGAEDDPVEMMPKKKVVFKPLNTRNTQKNSNHQTHEKGAEELNVAQASRLLHDPDTAKRSEKECHSVTEQSPTRWRGVQMPAGLREARHQLDLAVDRIYRPNPSPPTKNALSICLSSMRRCLPLRNNYLTELVKEQKLSLAFPTTPTHERQAYCTTSSLPGRAPEQKA